MNNSIAIPQEIRNFLESILQDAGIQTPDEETQDKMVQELFLRLDRFIVSVIIDSLPDEELETFIRINEEERPQEEIEQFLKDRIPDFEDVFRNSLSEFRELYITNVMHKRNLKDK